jgi:LSD1 subclass zinc finger protein
VAKVTAKNCPKCGAPLALQRGISDVQCQYCGTVVHVEWDKKPPVNPQPQQMATIYVAPSLPAFVPVLIALAALVPIAGSLFAFFASGVTNVATNAFNAAGVKPPSVLTTSLPATCGLNQEVNIVGQKFEGPGPLITGEINCKVKIKDSTLKSDVVVLAKNLVEVTIENSTLEGKEAAVKLSMNSKLFGKKQAIIKGQGGGGSRRRRRQLRDHARRFEGRGRRSRHSGRLEPEAQRNEVDHFRQGLRHSLGRESRHRR